jgi:hypothetical protein
MSQVSYAWADNWRRRKLDVQAIGDKLATLEKSNALSADNVVEEARPAESVLHACFTWDDSIAAENYRKSEARHLIRSIITVVNDPDDEEDNVTVQAFVPIGNAAQGSQYVGSYHMATNEEVRKIVIRDAVAGLNGWKMRVERMEGMSDIIVIMNRLIKKMEDKITPAARIKKHKDMQQISPQ